jgi:hypothetical protein
MKKIVFVCMFIAPLAGCATAPQTQIVDTSCSWVRPIYVSKRDVLSDSTARQILSHDTKWKSFCGDKR